MQLSFTHGQRNCLFPVNKVEENGKEEEQEEITTRMQYIYIPQQCS